MNDSFEQFEKDLRSVRMTDGERAHIGRFLKVATAHSRAPGADARAWFVRHIFATGSLAVLIMLGGVSVSASSAHPNDILYGFRVQVNDRIEEALARDDDAWLDVQLRQMERQLEDEEVASDDFEADEQEHLDEDSGDGEVLDGDVEQNGRVDDEEGDDEKTSSNGWREAAQDERDASSDMEEARRIERDLGDEEQSAGEALISL